MIESTTGHTLRLVRLRVLIVALCALFLAGAGTTFLVARDQYTALPAVLAAKQVSIANLIGREIRRAVDLGIPMDALRGVDQLCEEARKNNSEIGYIVVADPTHVIASVGRTPPSAESLRSVPRTLPGSRPALTDLDSFITIAVPVADAGGKSIADIFIGIDPEHIKRLVSDRMYDVVTVLVVTAFLAVQVLMLILDCGVSGPLRALESWGQTVVSGLRPKLMRKLGFRELAQLVVNSNASLGKQPGDPAAAGGTMPWQVIARIVRMALFLFVLGDSLSLPFLPIFARDVMVPFWGLSMNFVLSLPVVVYWLTGALIQLFGVSLIERYTHRRIFLAGAVFSMAGLIYSAAATDMTGLLLSRALAGIGLGAVFLTCQAATLSNVPKELRTLGVASFTGSFFLATFCGSALGGIAAQQLGYRGAFVLSAAVVLISSIYAGLAMGDSREPPALAAKPGSGNSYIKLSKNPRFASLLLLCAVPNRAFNVALLLYLAPLYLYGMGSTKAEIGRVVAFYGVVMALIAPTVAKFVDKWKLQTQSVIFGSLLTGLGAAAVLLGTQTGVLLAVALMGVGQALSVPSQMSLVPVVGAREAALAGLPRVMSVFRVGERLPAFLGPFIAGMLANLFGFQNAIVTFGAWVTVSALILAGVLGGGRSRTAEAG